MQPNGEGKHADDVDEFHASPLVERSDHRETLRPQD